MARRSAPAWLAATVVSAAIGCGGGGGDEGPIQIGLLAPKSGALATVGQSFERISTTAIAKINAEGGINGRELVLTVADTRTDATTVADLFEGLITGSEIVAAVGPATSGEVNAAYSVARTYRVPIISPSSTAPFLSSPDLDDGGFMFRNVPDDTVQGLAMAYFLTQRRDPPVSRVAILYENSDYGRGLRDSFRAAFIDQTGDPAAVTDEIPFEQNLGQRATGAEEAAEKIAMLAAADPDPALVVMIALEGDAVILANAWDNGGDPVIPGMQLFMTDGARTQGLLDDAPASIAGMCGTAPTFPIGGYAYATLRTAFADAHPEQSLSAQVYAPNVWDAVYLIAGALLKQAHDHPREPLGGNHLRDALVEVSRDGQILHAGQWRQIVLATNAGNDVDYDGAAGPNNFNIVGQAAGPYEVWCVNEALSDFTQALFLRAEDLEHL
jgi:branched-chain amino acid transport system substrate-binding protein